MFKNIYETIFIATPVLSDNQAKEVAKEYENYINGNDGDVRFQENWGLKRLAYPIQKKHSGWYFLLEYSSPPIFINNFELKLKYDERIMRFLTIKFNKDSLEYSEKRRIRLNNISNNKNYNRK